MPGISMAVPQRPFRSLTINAWRLWELSRYQPPAAQFPALGHDTELTWGYPPVFNWAVPGISMAVPHRPFRSPATNTRLWPWPSL